MPPRWPGPVPPSWNKEDVRPRWNEETKVFEFVVKRLKELRRRVDHLDVIEGYPFEDSKEFDAMFALVMAELPDLGERAAREAAQRGDPEPLIYLLQRYFGDADIFKVNELSPETRKLLYEIIRGERNPETGKKKGERGRRRLTRKERRAQTPTYDAVALVPVIEAILRSNFPKEKKSAVNRRAMKFAVKICNADYDAVALLQRRPKKDRHQLP